ncbi:MAG: hypothetical protein ACREX4_21630 [Gammaproteobacteria bacterium]
MIRATRSGGRLAPALGGKALLMKKSVDSAHPDFWTSRYATGKTSWDFGGVPAALKSFLSRSSGPSKVLIPGCGTMEISGN